MAQVKIFSLRATMQSKQDVISNIIHSVLVDILSIPIDKCFHRFIYLEQGAFIYPSPRNECYTIIEIHLISGRSKETKKLMIKRLFHEFQQQLSFDPMDLEILILESAAENWGFRGLNGDEANLPYPLDV